MPDAFDLFDTLVLFAGLAVIIAIALHSSRRRSGTRWPAAAVIGVLAWLTTFVFALYLIFG